MYTHDKYGRPLSPVLFHLLNEMTIPPRKAAAVKPKRRTALRFVTPTSIPVQHLRPRALADVPALEIEDGDVDALRRVRRRSASREEAMVHPLGQPLPPAAVFGESTLAASPAVTVHPVDGHGERAADVKPILTLRTNFTAVQRPRGPPPDAEDAAEDASKDVLKASGSLQWLRTLIVPRLPYGLDGAAAGAGLISQKHEEIEIEHDEISELEDEDSEEELDLFDDDVPLPPLFKTARLDAYPPFPRPSNGPIRPRANPNYYRVLAMEKAMCRRGKMSEPLVSFTLPPRFNSGPRARQWGELTAADFLKDGAGDEKSLVDA